jgi:hypothetical protein
MEEDQSYRVEEPVDEETKDVEKKGLFKPLPSTRKEVTTDGKAEPIVTFFGIRMRERRRDLLLLILTPTLASIIDAGIIMNMYTAVGQQVNAGVLFIVCMLVGLLVGLTQTSSGRALFAGVINSILYMVVNILFTASPALFAPDLAPVDEFIFVAVAVTIPQVVLILPGCILGVFFGHIMKEVF